VRRQAEIEQVIERYIYDINTRRPKVIDFDKSESRQKAPAAWDLRFSLKLRDTVLFATKVQRSWGIYWIYLKFKIQSPYYSETVTPVYQNVVAHSTWSFARWNTRCLYFYM